MNPFWIQTSQFLNWLLLLQCGHKSLCLQNNKTNDFFTQVSTIEFFDCVPTIVIYFACISLLLNRMIMDVAFWRGSNCINFLLLNLVQPWPLERFCLCFHSVRASQQPVSLKMCLCQRCSKQLSNRNMQLAIKVHFHYTRKHNGSNKKAGLC